MISAVGCGFGSTTRTAGISLERNSLKSEADGETAKHSHYRGGADSSPRTSRGRLVAAAAKTSK